MRCGPGSASARRSCAANSAAVSARLAGTPMPSAIAVKSRPGRDRSSMLRAVGPAAGAPVRSSSMFKIAYERLLKMTVVMSSCSRAWVQSAEIVYMALPSASSARTCRTAI